MLDELFVRMQFEPVVLLFGNNYNEIDRSVFDYEWNCVVTTNCESDLSALLDNGRREVRNITSIAGMQSNLLDKRYLHVVRLFGETYPNDKISELEKEDITDKAYNMLTRVSDAIKRNGIILIENFSEELFTHKELRRVFKELYHNQKQVYFFNCKDTNPYLDHLEQQGIAILIESTISDFFQDYGIQGDDEDEVDFYTNNVDIYINAEHDSKLTKFDKKQLLETESFATLLNIQLLNSLKIPNNMYQDYFYSFLKNSAKEPQWYGYNYGFNIHRKYEEILYEKVKSGLENAGKSTSKPLLLVGQTGTGKSIALAAVAYKIFNEKKYPVVYINDSDINFYSQTEYKNGRINKMYSPAFNALDSLLERIENLGANAVFLVWDTSSYSTGREKCFKLYQALLARGRKFFLLCTAYESHLQIASVDADENNVEDTLMNKKFAECWANVQVSDELEQLNDILLNKCQMKKQDVERIIEYSKRATDNYLFMLYYLFDSIRNNLSQGVYKEANANLQNLDRILEQNIKTSESVDYGFKYALKKIESDLIKAGIVTKLNDEDDSCQDTIEVSKIDFVKCLAVCSRFKLKMPYDFALRILGSYDYKIIQELTKSTFFIINEDVSGDYEISIRTPLEAEMFLSANSMLAEDEVECVIKMIDLMNPQGGYGGWKEVRLCERLVRIMGPNHNENKRMYHRCYESIISCLKRLREERNIWEPILVSQEITYIREYYGVNEIFDKNIRIKALEEAIYIANEVLNKAEFTGISIGARNAIIVESANSKILLTQLKESKDSLMYKEIRRDLRHVIHSDNYNYHAYVTLLKGSVIEYKNESDGIKQVELLESLCTAVDELILENPDVENSEYFQRKVTEIYSLLKEKDTVSKYVDELVLNGSSAGLYVIAKKILLENDVKFNKPIRCKEQLEACERVYELFNNKKYKTVSETSKPCQYMLLNILWLMKNTKPMFSDGECWVTAMNQDVWKEVLGICSNFIARFCDDSENSDPYGINIKYIKALSLAQLEQYIESISLLRDIKEDETLGRSRMYTRHMLCKENGEIRTFKGRLGKYNELKRSGEIYIDEFGKSPIYYYGPHMKSSRLDEGKVFTDIQIGYSLVAPKAFRLIKDGE